MDKSLKQENIMGTLPVGRLLFSMAMPMVISMLVQALYNIVDSMFVGMISATDDFGLTALSLAFPIQNLMIAFATGTGVGINSYLSRALGEKDIRAVNRSAGNGIFLTFLTFVAFALFGLFGTEWYFTTQTANPVIHQNGVDYLSVVLIFSAGIFFEITMERLLQATGKSKLSMYSQLLGAISNIILDPIFILPKGAKVFLFTLPFGFNMGTRGAAIATVTGQFLAASLGLILNLTKNKEISFHPKNLLPDIGIIGTIYKVGLPSIFMAAVGSFLTMALNKILTIGEAVKLGIPVGKAEQVGVTVYGIYFKLQSFIFMPVFGLNNGMIPIVAYNYGARRKDRILGTIKLSMLCAVCYMALGMVVFFTIPDKLLSIFSPSALAMEFGVPALRTLCLCFLFAGVCIVSISSLQALGQGMASLVISLIRQIVVILPLSYVFAVNFGIDVVWYAFPIAEFVSLCVSLLMLFRANRKYLSKLDIPGAKI